MWSKKPFDLVIIIRFGSYNLAVASTFMFTTLTSHHPHALTSHHPHTLTSHHPHTLTSHHPHLTLPSHSHLTPPSPLSLLRSPCRSPLWAATLCWRSMGSVCVGVCTRGAWSRWRTRTTVTLSSSGTCLSGTPPTVSKPLGGEWLERNDNS